MEQVIEINPGLWIVIENCAPEYDDGLITLRDSTGGNTLIDRDEIPALLIALEKVQEEGKKTQAALAAKKGNNDE